MKKSTIVTFILAFWCGLSLGFAGVFVTKTPGLFFGIFLPILFLHYMTLWFQREELAKEFIAEAIMVVREYAKECKGKGCDEDKRDGCCS